MSKSTYVRKPIRGLDAKAKLWAEANNKYTFAVDRWLQATNDEIKLPDKTSYIKSKCRNEPIVPDEPTYKKPDLFIPILSLILSGIICLVGFILCNTLLSDWSERIYGMSYLGFPFLIFVGSIVIIYKRKELATRNHNNKINDRNIAISNHNEWEKERDKLTEEWELKSRDLKANSDKLLLKVREISDQLSTYSKVGKNSIYNIIKNELVFYFDFSDDDAVNEAIDQVALEIIDHPDLTFYQVIDKIKKDREWYRIDQTFDTEYLENYLASIPVEEVQAEVDTRKAFREAFDEVHCEE